jgi:hypothetical protein
VPIENAQETAFLNCNAGMVGEVTPEKLGENPQSLHQRFLLPKRHALPAEISSISRKLREKLL